MLGDLRDLLGPHLHAGVDDWSRGGTAGQCGAPMAFLFLAGVTVAYWAEARGNPMLTAVGADQEVSALSPGGNMEGKETRFGIANTALFATITTDASCGAVNGWHDSFTPLGGLVPLANIQLSEVVFGGVGAGMYGVLVYIILSVFIAGLMVGRTPEYLGKKIQAFEVQMAMLTVLIFSLADPDVHRDLVRLTVASAHRASSMPDLTVSRRCSTRIRLPPPTTGRRSAASASTRPGTTSRLA